MSNSWISEDAHFELISGVEVNALSPLMHEIGKTLGEVTVEHGLIGFGDPNPMRIHSEIIYHDDMLLYFMLGCVKRADEGGANILYDAVKAAFIIKSEAPELDAVTMVFHAEHYEDTKAIVPLLRSKNGRDFLAFRQKKADLNEIHNLPEGWNEALFYEYIDSVLHRCVEFEHVLEPGELLIVNNYRTLHVRTAYTGLRKMIRVRVDDPETHQNYII